MEPLSAEPGPNAEDRVRALLQRSGRTRHAWGNIERIAAPAKLAEAEPWQLGNVYAEGGLWYDALAFISSGIDREPAAPRLRELRAALLEQVGLQQAADSEHRAPE